MMLTTMAMMMMMMMMVVNINNYNDQGNYDINDDFGAN